MIGNYHEDLKLIEALKEASGLDATEDDTNHLLVCRWVSRSGKLVDIWTSSTGVSYTVGHPVTNNTGYEMHKSIKSSQEAFMVFAEMLAK